MSGAPPAPDGARFGCIADDITGATDLAGALVDRAVPTMLSFAVPHGVLRHDAAAVVIALKTRTMPAAPAREQVRRSARRLREQGVVEVFSKYCSTFGAPVARLEVAEFLAALAPGSAR